MVALSPSRAERPRAAARPAGPQVLPRPRGRTLAISVIASLALLAGWFAVTQAGLMPPLFLPSPLAVA